MKTEQNGVAAIMLKELKQELQATIMLIELNLKRAELQAKIRKVEGRQQVANQKRSPFLFARQSMIMPGGRNFGATSALSGLSMMPGFGSKRFSAVF